MFRVFRTKIAVIATAIVLPIGSLLAFGSGQASAVSSVQICASNGSGTACLNAWNGGPFVYAYSMGAAPHDEFTIGQLSNGNAYIKYAGGGSWNGQCVGDAYNDPNYVTTSLDPCPTNTSSGGWGTNFREESCGQGYAFKNTHHGGYLYPSSYSNGASFYLNGNSRYCFGFFDPTYRG